MKRRPLTKLQRVRVFDRCGGICLHCWRKIHVGEPWQAMHVKSLWLGGTDTEDNMWPGHIDCHATQTKAEAPQRAKSDRIRQKHLGLRKPRSFTRWRNMRGEIVTATRER